MIDLLLSAMRIRPKKHRFIGKHHVCHNYFLETNQMVTKSNDSFASVTVRNLDGTSRNRQTPAPRQWPLTGKFHGGTDWQLLAASLGDRVGVVEGHATPGRR
jgi:hypothetical protein